jgi:hypothetical protein
MFKDLKIIKYSSLTDVHWILTGLRWTQYNYTIPIHIRSSHNSKNSIDNNLSRPTIQRQVIRVSYSRPLEQRLHNILFYSFSRKVYYKHIIRIAYIQFYVSLFDTWNKYDPHTSLLSEDHYTMYYIIN